MIIDHAFKAATSSAFKLKRMRCLLFLCFCVGISETLERKAREKSDWMWRRDHTLNWNIKFPSKYSIWQRRQIFDKSKIEGWIIKRSSILNLAREKHTKFPLNIKTFANASIHPVCDIFCNLVVFFNISLSPHVFIGFGCIAMCICCIMCNSQCNTMCIILVYCIL